ncbi:nucleotidyltransferase family protein [Patescibacteria group bacterium]|nr:nucleotidyltransferase family protein [Patescibacteria group bacterium]MBU4512462.1 nucleotidyltransferase family protein [Patescibacteria group bacterium]MCG2692590.1 nucleotidyltransferase family protein [Candidatus Parcubacteria bacterium]
MSTKEIQEKIISELPVLKEKYQVKKLGIFGSRVRGDDEPGCDGDTDIMVEFYSPPGFFDFIRLENFLAKTLNKKVDLVTKKALKPAIKKGVLKEMVYV